MGKFTDANVEEEILDICRGSWNLIRNSDFEDKLPLEMLRNLMKVLIFRLDILRRSLFHNVFHNFEPQNYSVAN